MKGVYHTQMIKTFSNVNAHIVRMVHTMLHSKYIYLYDNMWHTYNIYDMDIIILACHLTCIVFRGLRHENGNLNFVCDLTDILLGVCF